MGGLSLKRQRNNQLTKFLMRARNSLQLEKGSTTKTLVFNWTKRWPKRHHLNRHGNVARLLHLSLQQNSESRCRKRLVFTPQAGWGAQTRHANKAQFQLSKYPLAMVRNMYELKDLYHPGCEGMLIPLSCVPTATLTVL